MAYEGVKRSEVRSRLISALAENPDSQNIFRGNDLKGAARDRDRVLIRPAKGKVTEIARRVEEIDSILEDARTIKYVNEELRQIAQMDLEAALRVSAALWAVAKNSWDKRLVMRATMALREYVNGSVAEGYGAATHLINTLKGSVDPAETVADLGSEEQKEKITRVVLLRRHDVDAN